MIFPRRTVEVIFHGEHFRLPRNWNPAQVAEFLQTWQQNKLSDKVVPQ